MTQYGLLNEGEGMSNYDPMDFPLPMHKCCMYHSRDWSEMQRGKYPPSEHSQGCSEFKLKDFYSVVTTYDSGSSCIVDSIEEAEQIIRDDHELKIVPIKLTQDQFNNLHEFIGW